MSLPSTAHPDSRTAFARELACHPDHHAITVRLRAGHDPDQHGWCRHGAHSHHGEHHPCSVVRLADLVDRVAASVAPPAHPGPGSPPPAPAPAPVAGWTSSAAHSPASHSA